VYRGLIREVTEPFAVFVWEAAQVASLVSEMPRAGLCQPKLVCQSTPVRASPPMGHCKQVPVSAPVDSPAQLAYLPR
jgi:hypothetical protein